MFSHTFPACVCTSQKIGIVIWHLGKCYLQSRSYLPSTGIFCLTEAVFDLLFWGFKSHTSSLQQIGSRSLLKVISFKSQVTLATSRSEDFSFINYMIFWEVDSHFNLHLSIHLANPFKQLELFGKAVEPQSVS